MSHPHSFSDQSRACADVDLFYFKQEISVYYNSANKSGWGSMALNRPVGSSYLEIANPLTLFASLIDRPYGLSLFLAK
jgi:hypothetical protein